MKVLQVNSVYRSGSTGKIMYDLHSGLLSRGYESVVCYGHGETYNEYGVYKVCSEWYSKLNNAISRFTGVVYDGFHLSTNKLISIVEKEKPDIVHLQCINGYFISIWRLVEWLKRNNIKVVLTLHAEFMYTGGCGHALDCEQWKTLNGCGYLSCPRLKEATQSLLLDRTNVMWRKMKAAFDGFDNRNLVVVSVSPWLSERAKLSSIFENRRHYVIYNGLDGSTFKPCESNGIREKIGIRNEKVIFYVTPKFTLDQNVIKGGCYVKTVAEKLYSQNIKIVVAGDYKVNSRLPDNMIMLGRVSDQNKLAQLYSMADLTLLTSKKETFSMVVAESLSCGTPVAGFKAGAPEQIALSDYSMFCENGDVDQLLKNIHAMLGKNFDRNKIASDALNVYSQEKMVDSYIDIYKLLMQA